MWQGHSGRGKKRGAGPWRDVVVLPDVAECDQTCEGGDWAGAFLLGMSPVRETNYMSRHRASANTLTGFGGRVKGAKGMRKKRRAQ